MRFTGFKPITISLYIFSLAIFILACFAFAKYPGQGYVYVLFTITLNALLLFGFRKDHIFFDTFIGIFFWLGFWLKFSVRVAFMRGQFFESIGNFNYFNASFDHALNVTSCGVVAFLMASLLRSRLFSYAKLKDLPDVEPVLNFYRRYRKYIWAAFFSLFIFIAVTNVYWGIYQRGSVPRTILPFGLNGVYKWLLLFGLASLSSILLNCEFKMNKKPYSVVGLCLMESFFSNLSMLSRGMIFNVSALVIGVIESLKKQSIILSIRFKFLTLFMIVFLFIASVFTVNYLRMPLFFNASHLDFSSSAASVSKITKILFIDRWIGIEGVMAVASHPELGWNLWRTAWQEKYSDFGTSMYDSKIIKTPLSDFDMSKHHFISLPGILAFFYYPGSFVFLFFSMFILGLLAAGIEFSVYKLGGSNIILCSLIGQVVAYRYAHFGYVPGQSYLLFGTIFLNVLIIYFFNKILVILNYKKAQ